MKSYSMAEIKEHADRAETWPDSGVLNWNEIRWDALAAWVTLSVDIAGDATLPDYNVESVKGCFERWWRTANGERGEERREGMPLNKSTGMMYDWVSHTHTHLGGACPHACVYCSVEALKRYPECAAKYSGPLRLIEKELEIRYGSGKEIFVENLNDLWAASVPADYIRRVLNHCRQWPENLYIFQTKNPDRYLNFESEFPINVNIGCTIETNWETASLSKAPPPAMRVPAMQYLARRFKTFVTVEPILDFDLAEFLAMLVSIRPAFVNVGADSKGHKLPEPSSDDIAGLVAGLQKAGIEIREKHNLDRLMKGEA